jgi:hypothetical protein
MLQRLQLILRETESKIIKQDIFAASNLYSPATDAIQKTFGKILWPITWLDGAGCGENPIGGIR